MYQGYTQSKGDCQALGLVVYQLANFLLHAERNRMWLIETEDAPTMTPGKGDNQNDEVVPGQLSGSYNSERSFSVSFTRNGDNWFISASAASIGNNVAVSCLCHSRTPC